MLAFGQLDGSSGSLLPIFLDEPVMSDKAIIKNEMYNVITLCLTDKTSPPKRPQYIAGNYFFMTSFLSLGNDGSEQFGIL